jgi:hypothetical protein
LALGAAGEGRVVVAVEVPEEIEGEERVTLTVTATRRDSPAVFNSATVAVAVVGGGPAPGPSALDVPTVSPAGLAALALLLAGVACRRLLGRA